MAFINCYPLLMKLALLKSIRKILCGTHFSRGWVRKKACVLYQKIFISLLVQSFTVLYFVFFVILHLKTIWNFWRPCYRTAMFFVSPRPTLGHWWGGSLVHLMSIKAVFLIWEPWNKAGSQSIVECISWIGTMNFQI